MKSVTRILNNLRLALFPIGYGLTGALMGGTLNRVMIAELDLPASLVGFTFAIPLMISPIRVWLGYRSDGYPIVGRRREPYMILGGLITGLGIILATTTAVNIAQTSTALVIGVLVAFIIYGVGRNLGHNTFQALLSDRFSGIQRSRAITLYEVATLLGLVAGAGGLGGALENYEPTRLITVSIGVATIFLVLAVIAALGQEPRDSASKTATDTARKIPFPQVLREIVLADKQVRLFFTLVIFTFVGTLAQDVLLEPYGALVLDMSVGDTTRLTMFWGIGVMISMLLSGIILLKVLGYMAVMRTGIIASMLVFIGVIISGAVGNPGLFNLLVLFMGLGTGLAGAGMLAGLINFTTPVRAGLLMGVWGVANQVGHAFGSLMGGSVVDIMRAITNNNSLIAYTTVFGLEVVFLGIAFYLSTRLQVSESRAREEQESLVAATIPAPAAD
jgi:BCD family chlorophyll transporter-like MFS transporter